MNIETYDLSIFYRDNEGKVWRKNFYGISRNDVNEYNAYYREHYEVLKSIGAYMNTQESI